LQPHPQENNIIITAQVCQLDLLSNGRIELDLYAFHIQDRIVFGIHDLLVDAVNWDAVAHHPSSFRTSLKDGYLVTQTRHIMGYRQPSRASTDHSNSANLAAWLSPQPA
jgi:hypothetical protein